MSTAARSAFDALCARFTREERVAISPRPTLDVVQEARARRAAALLDSRLEETDESRRETPVIRTVHAFHVEARA